MIQAFLRAIGQLFEPSIGKFVAFSVALSIAVFVGLCIGVYWLQTSTTLSNWPVVEWIVDVLGYVATLIVSFFLFPVVMSAMVGLFLEPVARAIETKDYPNAGAPHRLPFLAALGATIRFLLKALLVNFLLLLFLLFPPAYPVAWLVANAYLLSREYFELVAMRHLLPKEARLLRQRNGNSLLLGGAIAAGMFAIPVVNLVAPVVVTIAMVHMFHRWRPQAAPATTGMPSTKTA